MSFAASYLTLRRWPSDVRVERLEPGEPLQSLLEDGDFLVAVHALDLEDRLGVQLADRAGRHFGSSTCV